MMELQRLLDGLEVSVEPFVGCPDGAVLELADGVTVRLADDSVIVLPPARRAVNGGIRITFEGSISLFHHLREPLVERVAASDPLRACFEELLHELNGHRPGSRGMAEALLRRCLILLLRRCCERGFRPEWVAALEDPRVGRVIAAMHDRPEQTFTLLDLADLAGMSRSVFAARFMGALGRSPIEFLTELRLARAAQILTGTDLPVKTVARRVGYSSRSSFTRAFLARHGLAPMAFRSAARAEEAA